MELPYYPRFLVRQFARPILRYPKEYHEALRLCGMKRWPELKKTLSSNDADAIVAHVITYMKYERMIQGCYQTLKTVNVYTMPYSEYDRIFTIIRESETQRTIAHNKMLALS